MTARLRGNVTLQTADGTPFQWEQFSMTERFDDPLGAYSFTCRPTRARLRDYQQFIQKGELVGIKIDDAPRAAVMIESMSTTSDRGGITISAQCKSVLQVATQASANPTIYKKNENDIPIKDLIIEVLGPFGFTEIETDAAGNAMTLSGKPIGGKAPAITASELKVKDVQVQDNENAYSYCARLFSRLGVALRVNYEGRLLLTAPDYDQDYSYTIVEDRVQTTRGDRAISISLNETNSQQFSRVVIRGNPPQGRKKKQTAQPLAATKQKYLTGRFNGPGSFLENFAREGYAKRAAGQPYENAIETELEPGQPYYTSSSQPFKPRYILDKRSRDNEKCSSLCKLAHGKNAPQAFEVTATVDGLVASSGAIWTIDTICRVFSDTLLLDHDMWVYETAMSVSKSGGSRTTLKLLPKNSLILGDRPG